MESKTCPICRCSTFKSNKIKLNYDIRDGPVDVEKEIDPEILENGKLKEENKNLKEALNEIKEKYTQLTKKLDVSIQQLQDIMVRISLI
jgi:seryl-tRNA synthetase